MPGTGILSVIAWLRQSPKDMALAALHAGSVSTIQREESERPLRKSPYPIVLSITQTAVTAVLTVWADRVDWLRGDSNRIPPPFLKIHLLVIELRQVWRGVNAPTFPLNFAGQKRFQIFGLSVSEMFYLLAVAALWFLAGHFLAQRKEQIVSTELSTRPGKRISIAVVVWGAMLFLLALIQIREAFPWGFSFRIFNPTALLNVPLYTLWSVVLIRFAFKALRPPTPRTSINS